MKNRSRKLRLLLHGHVCMLTCKHEKSSFLPRPTQFSYMTCVSKFSAHQENVHYAHPCTKLYIYIPVLMDVRKLSGCQRKKNKQKDTTYVSENTLCTLSVSTIKCSSLTLVLVPMRTINPQLDHRVAQLDPPPWLGPETKEGSARDNHCIVRHCHTLKLGRRSLVSYPDLIV